VDNDRRQQERERRENIRKYEEEQKGKRSPKREISLRITYLENDCGGAENYKAMKVPDLIYYYDTRRPKQTTRIDSRKYVRAPDDCQFDFCKIQSRGKTDSYTAVKKFDRHQFTLVVDTEQLREPDKFRLACYNSELDEGELVFSREFTM